MTQPNAYRPAKPRVRPLGLEARRRRAALKPKSTAPGQIYTDWACI